MYSVNYCMDLIILKITIIIIKYFSVVQHVFSWITHACVLESTVVLSILALARGKLKL